MIQHSVEMEVILESMCEIMHVKHQNKEVCVYQPTYSKQNLTFPVVRDQDCSEKQPI